MSGVTIYMEGGGDSKDQKAQIRQGMSRFLATLKDKASARNWKWKLTLCGGRRAAYEAFLNARRRPAAGELIVLLVDSEAPVTATTRAAHLHDRPGDGWDLTGVPEAHIHLMVQAMEAWVVADPDALATYYGHRFLRNALPTRANLEEEPKADCAKKLSAATRPTQKGEYQKIRHAADLLARISSEKVRARCPHAEIMFSTLSSLIA
jgi:Domain of unknown function (DUF4276)